MFGKAGAKAAAKKGQSATTSTDPHVLPPSCPCVRLAPVHRDGDEDEDDDDDDDDGDDEDEDDHGDDEADGGDRARDCDNDDDNNEKVLPHG